MNTMPHWLQAHLTATGTMTESGLFRTARLIKCPHCKQPVLAGLDAEICAAEVHCDPIRLSRAGEALATLDGRRTYELTPRSGKRALEEREHPGQISRNPADKCITLAAHKCDQPITAAWALPETPQPQYDPSAPAAF